jgi:hypothetical protein
MTTQKYIDVCLEAAMFAVCAAWLFLFAVQLAQ